MRAEDLEALQSKIKLRGCFEVEALEARRVAKESQKLEREILGVRLKSLHIRRSNTSKWPK